MVRPALSCSMCARPNGFSFQHVLQIHALFRWPQSHSRLLLSIGRCEINRRNYELSVTIGPRGRESSLPSSAPNPVDLSSTKYVQVVSPALPATILHRLTLKEGAERGEPLTFILAAC